MAYDESLANRVRAALGNTRRVQERRMFGGLVFMVRGKMCVSVGKEQILCRLDPAIRVTFSPPTGDSTLHLLVRSTLDIGDLSIVIIARPALVALTQICWA